VTSTEDTPLDTELDSTLDTIAHDKALDPASDPVPAVAPVRTGWRQYAIDTRPLRHAPYRRMFVGSATSFFGAQFTAIAVPIQIYAMTRESLWVGIASVAGLVPLLVFALWGGALADQLDRRKLLLSSSLLMWLVTLALLAQSALHLNNRWLLIALVAVQSGAVAVTMPTRSAIIPRIVPKSEIAQANTLNFTMSNAAMVLGPLAAGFIIAKSSVTTAYVVDSITFTVAMWAALRLPAMPPIGRSGTKRAGAWSDIMFGLRYLATTPVLLLSFAVDIVAMVLAQPRALFPASAEFVFGKGSIAWLYSAVAIGSVVAGLSSGWIARVRRQGLALIVAVVAWGAAIALSGLAHQLWLVVVLLAVGGAADLVSAVYRQTMLQTYTTDDLRGRMQGVFTAVVAGGPRLGDLRAGLMAGLTSTTFAWVGGGIACVVVAIAIGVAFPALARYRVGGATNG
jgi:MFS family permease